jgi:hypothetical protein
MTMGLYCTIYVYTRTPLLGVLEMLADATDGSLSFRSISASGFEISGVTNDEFDAALAAEGAGDFLYFPYFLEIEEADPTDDRDIARTFIADLLNCLRTAGFDYVTSADFEEELPNNGRSRDYGYLGRDRDR